MTMTANDQDAAPGTREERLQQHLNDGGISEESFLSGWDACSARLRTPERALREIADSATPSQATLWIARRALEGSPGAPEQRGRFIKCQGCPTVECTCMTELEADLLDKCNELIKAAGCANINQALARLAALAPDARDAEIDVRTVLIMVMSSAQMEKDGHNWLTCDSPSCVLARQAIFPKPQGGA